MELPVSLLTTLLRCWHDITPNILMRCWHDTGVALSFPVSFLCVAALTPFVSTTQLNPWQCLYHGTTCLPAHHHPFKVRCWHDITPNILMRWRHDTGVALSFPVSFLCVAALTPLGIIIGGSPVRLPPFFCWCWLLSCWLYWSLVMNMVLAALIMVGRCLPVLGECLSVGVCLFWVGVCLFCLLVSVAPLLELVACCMCRELWGVPWYRCGGRNSCVLSVDYVWRLHRCHDTLKSLTTAVSWKWLFYCQTSGNLLIACSIGPF